MQHETRNKGYEEPAGVPTAAELDAAAGRMARFHRLSWRQALAALTGPVLRMHRYREARARMLYDALYHTDRGDDRPDGDRQGQ